MKRTKDWDGAAVCRWPGPHIQDATRAHCRRCRRTLSVNWATRIEREHRIELERRSPPREPATEDAPKRFPGFPQPHTSILGLAPCGPRRHLLATCPFSSSEHRHRSERPFHPPFSRRSRRYTHAGGRLRLMCFPRHRRSSLCGVANDPLTLASVSALGHADSKV